jgi:hypothetical protein
VEGLRAAYATAAGLGLIAGLTVFRMLGRRPSELELPQPAEETDHAAPAEGR